ncbi:MAG: hypothetical protein RBS80_17655 [Thermoguttaceae bacterium]|nr:hypothetical protein [Thermoguttaceae bacterium]
MPTLETSEDGGLHLPPELIGGVQPHARFELEIVGNMLLLRPADQGQPLWRQGTAQQRVEAFQRWANAPRPAAPDLSDEFLRRENLYD